MHTIIYIYIYRERERQVVPPKGPRGDREGAAGRHEAVRGATYIYIYIYIYIYMCIYIYI